jgi:hypothetical protein
MSQVQKLCCPACGSPRKLIRFGITEEGFDAAQFPAYNLALRIDTMGGRGNLEVELQPMPLPTARALRESLNEALARLNAEIDEAEAASG